MSNVIQFKRDKDQKSNKKHLDQYYTDIELAEDLIRATKDILSGENITEIIEPSAGKGAFSSQIDGCIAYDIEPKADNISKANYLKVDLPYKKGRLFIGNPPFGDRLNLARKFIKKTLQRG